MKKILALLMALALLATLTACGEKTEPNTDTNTTTTTSADTTTTTDAEESTTTTDATTTDATDESTTTATEGTSSTAKPTETTKTDAPHTHKYTSKVTKAATCAAEGVKTFTCSCGDTYTEKIATTAHKWSEWKQTTAPSYTAKGKETRTCSVCSKKETRDVAQLSLDKLFEEYVRVAFALRINFNSPDELAGTSVDSVFFHLIDFRYKLVEPIQSTRDGDTHYQTFAISDLDAITKKYYNYTWDFASLDGKTAMMYQCTYDAENQTIITATATGWGGPVDETVYEGYTQTDSTHFVISFHTIPNDMPDVYHGTINVELINGKYVIVAYDGEYED